LHVIPYERSIAAAMTTVWPTVERLLNQHGTAVLVTIAQSVRSSPREVGDRMAVRPDGQLLIRRDAVAAAAPFPEHATIVACGTLHG
jgi:hypothetical protein